MNVLLIFKGFITCTEDSALNGTNWLVSNFIPMDSKKFGFRNFDWIIRFAIKNESEIEKFRSRDRWIVGKKRF